MCRSCSRGDAARFALRASIRQGVFRAGLKPRGTEAGEKRLHEYRALSGIVNTAMSRFDSKNIRGLGNQVNVPINMDDDGYLGRECPVEECLGYFKITPGTGIQGPAPCHCPYCGHAGDNSKFWTQDQIKYARSVALRTFVEAFQKDLKSMEFEQRPQDGFEIGMSMKFTPGLPHPIKYYKEKELETHVTCDNCMLRYAIYGVFGWCPDCGIHNSNQILMKNLELASKELTLSETADQELADYLTGDALENVVSAFDAFGRQICSTKTADIQFQNLAAARRRVQGEFQFDFADVLTPDDWESMCRVFQKRHLLAHKMGVVDDDYLKKAKDPQAILGRKVGISRDEVVATIRLVEAIGKRLFAGILHPTS